MGTFLAVFCENKERFLPCAQKIEFKPDGIRRLLASRSRYLVGDVYCYVPGNVDWLEETDRLCWVRDREYHNLEDMNEAYHSGELNMADVRIGNTYIKRRKEEGGKFVEVESFVSRELYQGLEKNPDVLASLSKDDFESLCAEIFVRRGFEVDLFRKSQDGGIDFLAVKGDEIDPSIFAVQCKQSDIRENKKRRALGRPVVQQIYGAAKAWDLSGSIALSGSTYSKQAADFVSNKPTEMQVHDADQIHKWIKKYRWNEDE